MGTQAQDWAAAGRRLGLGYTSLFVLAGLGMVHCAGSADSAARGRRGNSDDADAGFGSSDASFSNADGAAATAVPDLDAGHDAGRDADTTGCGDGKIQPGEKCDDGNSHPGDGCSASCDSNEEGFACPVPGQKCVSTIACGDGRVAGQETCDDGNLASGDGCTIACQVEPGYACPAPGARCIAKKCGDGIVAGKEECDDSAAAADGDGCSKTCQLEPGYACDTPGQACVPTVCNDGIKQGSEPCDDGNQVVGDGCTPFCEVEPKCATGDCSSRCGDGLILPTDAEQCDDGNTRNDDGCSSTCQTERGYTCILVQGTLPATLQVPVTYRDFISLPTGGSTKHPDFEQFSGSSITPNLVAADLDTNGKPLYTGNCDGVLPEGICSNGQQTTTSAAFDQWYHDVPGVNVTKVLRLPLSYDATNGWYKFTTTGAGFFPWDGDATSWVGQGKENTSSGHDFGFTSEVRYWFQYDATQTPTLSFDGDDDVWVFIHRKLAVDIGGLHPPQHGAVTLDAAKASALGMQDGHVYEIVLFHAERHTTGSNFNLTLNGFTSRKSTCTTTCGDGIVAGDEDCDNGTNDGSYGTCTSGCKRAPFCGDGTQQPSFEACDDGVNLTTYVGAGSPGCAPGCKTSASCGDKHVDSLFGEQCDDGTNAGGYGQCAPGCTLGPRCGDGVVQADQGELCDDANLVSGDGCARDCTSEAPG